MLTKEFRIVLPVSVEEYQVGQLYAVAEASKGETGGGEGVEVLENKKCEDEPEKGWYTHKIYYLKSKVSPFIAQVAPEGSLVLHEEAWNAYPYCRTVLTNEYLKDAFEIEIRTWHKPDMGEEDNVHGLETEEWKKVEVVNIDIADNKKISRKDYKEEEDPEKFQSKETGRGPLKEGWQEDLRKDPSKPHMCCYKLVTVKFNWKLIGGKVRSEIQKFEERLFTNFHRKLFCSLDEWCHMTMDDIRNLENETKAELDQLRKSGEVKGTKTDK